MNEFKSVGFQLLECTVCGKRIKENSMGKASHLKSKAHLMVMPHASRCLVIVPPRRFHERFVPNFGDAVTAVHELVGGDFAAVEVLLEPLRAKPPKDVVLPAQNWHQDKWDAAIESLSLVGLHATVVDVEKEKA